MHRFETIDLGSYRGEDYFLVGFVEPDPVGDEAYDPDAEAYAYGVALARSTEIGANIQIVRLDTAHGQEPHVDLVYLPPGDRAERQVRLDETFTYSRMKQYLLAHWRDFVDGYIHYNE